MTDKTDMTGTTNTPASLTANVAPGIWATNRALLTAGVVGPLLFIVVFLIEEATRPGYSAWRHFVSQLSLSGQGWEQAANFIVCGVLCLAFAVGLRRTLAGGRGATWGPILLGVFALSLILAGIFSTGPALGYPPGVSSHGPQTLHALIHGVCGLVAFTSLPAASFVLARRFALDPAWRRWVAYSIITGVVVFASLIGSNVTSVLDMLGTVPNAPTGFIQRIGIIAGWSWIAILAFRLLRSAPPHSRTVVVP